MARLAKERPITKTTVFQASRDEHEIWHIQATCLGKVKKDPTRGWVTEDGGVFDQEAEAISRLYQNNKMMEFQPAKKEKPQVRIVPVGDKTQLTLAGIPLPLTLPQLKPYRTFKTVINGNRIHLYGSKVELPADREERKKVAMDDKKMKWEEFTPTGGNPIRRGE